MFLNNAHSIFDGKWWRNIGQIFHAVSHVKTFTGFPLVGFFFQGVQTDILHRKMPPANPNIKRKKNGQKYPLLLSVPSPSGIWFAVKKK